MKKWKKGLFSVGIFALGLALAACSSGGNTNDTANSSSTKADDSTFTYAISGDPSSTNPINTSDRWGLTVTNIIYSPLVIVEGDGTTKNALAESVEPAADGLSVTVHLKKDVKWSDGEPFTAD
ncbi:MAG TPA: ABC transporter substrate-binding protein, partial [Enterococcus sp.]|nr:ABC transporter substrate-binding protein [Enterococcus sp.]